MSYRCIAAVALAALVLGGCAFGSRTTSADLRQMEKEIEADLAKAGESEAKVVCRKEQKTGSHHIRTVCYRHQAKEDMERRNRDALRRLKRGDGDNTLGGG